MATRRTLKPDRLKLPTIPWHVRCNWCGHVRSSHLKLVLFGRCKAEACECLCFDTRCGCGHLLSAHTWSDNSSPWACCIGTCKCKGFGARQAQDIPPEQPQPFP